MTETVTAAVPEDKGARAGGEDMPTIYADRPTPARFLC